MSRLREMIKELCPDGVEYRKLGELGDFFSGLIGKAKEDFSEGNAYFIPYMNVYSNPEVKMTRLEYVNVTENEAQNLVQCGDVLFTGSSETRNESGLSSVLTIQPEEKVYLNSFCFGYRFVNPQMFLPAFTKHLFRSSEMRHQIVRAANGVTRFNISKKKMANVVIPVPPLPVQNEIVKLLDNFTELTAELTAELALRKKQYEWYCGSLIGGATFPKRKISDIATFRYGYTTSAATSGDARYIRITDITDDGKLNPLDAKYTCISTENKEYLLKRDDLVMARTGATYGKTLCYNMDTPAIYASFLIKIQVDETQMLPRFYWHFTRTPEYWGQANRLVTKGGQPQFNTGAIGRIVIPIPPLDVQQKIVSILDRFDTLTSDLTQGLPAEIAARKKQYEYYRDKLLTFRRKGA